MIPNRLVFIGGGNMARSLVLGLIANQVPAQNLLVIDPNPEQRAQLAHTGVATYSTIEELPNGKVDAVLLAVKPQVMPEVAKSLTDFVQQHQPLVISVAAGIRCQDLNRWLGGEQAIVRTMPNTPAMVQSGATGLFANERVNVAQKNQAESIMRAVGLTLWVSEEEQLDAVTALSGSGPAYLFLMIEAMTKGGIALGLDAQTAQLLALQTTFGAAKMAIESKTTPEQLRQQVTSPNGTTERAITLFQENNFPELVAQAMQAAQTRARELSEQLGAVA
jgi:pyrroline-5-carboxylate reductase